MLFNETKRKVIFIDWSIFVHKAIFARQEMPITYTCIRMILSILKLLSLKETDLIIFAIDSSKGNWRKQLDTNYKANRADIRKKSGLDWDELFGEFSEFLENINVSTPFHVVEIDNLEADDIIAYGCRYYKDDDCIIVSSDTDYEQLTAFENVKLLSSNSKKFKIVKNPYKSLAKKIQYEKTDNLISPILNQQDFDLRNKIVNLLTLPAEVESPIHFELSKITDTKDFDIELFRFEKLQQEILNIYLPQKKTVSINDSFKKKRKKVEQNTLF